MQLIIFLCLFQRESAERLIIVIIILCAAYLDEFIRVQINLLERPVQWPSRKTFIIRRHVFLC